VLIKTTVNDSIIEFLKKDYLINLNILGVLENVPEAEIYVDDVDNPSGVLVKQNEYMHLLYSKNDDFINEVVEVYLKTDFYGFSAVEASIAEKIMKKKEVTWDSPVTVYYMPEGNLDKSLIKNPVRSIDIKDAEEVDKYYQYRSSRSLEAIKRDITNRPSSAVYVDGQIACWVLIHDDDSMGIMYTKEEHRRKGYAVDVTVDLASKIMEQGKIPFIQIVKNNNMSPGLAQKCGFVECGQAKWFGIVSGIPEYLINSNVEGRKRVLNIAGEEMEGIFYNPDCRYHGMYLSMYNFKEDFVQDEDFNLINSLERDMLSTWCDIVSQVYKMSKEEREKFNTRILDEASKEKPLIIPFLGLRKGSPVSASALIEVDGDVYELCCLGTVNNNDSLLELTLNETLRVSREKHSFLVVAQPSEKEKYIFDRLGFKTI